MIRSRIASLDLGPLTGLTSWSSGLPSINQREGVIAEYAALCYYRKISLSGYSRFVGPLLLDFRAMPLRFVRNDY
jgi:hypothetical protein